MEKILEALDIKQNNFVHAYIGQRIRERRKQLKLNQSQLAKMLGLSYQQIQKYEAGTSEVSISKLLQFAKNLNVPTSYFYEGADIGGKIGKGISDDIIQKMRTEPLSLLLVEDSPSDIILFRKAINTCQEQVDLNIFHSASDVNDFLQNHEKKFGKRMPDLIVLEMSLNKANGTKILKSIKSNAQTARIPVIILTHSVSRQQMHDAYRMGASGFIQKNIDSARYIESIDTLIKYWAKTVVLPGM